MTKREFSKDIQELMSKVLYNLKVTGDRETAGEYSKELSETIDEAVRVLGYETAKPLIREACDKAEA